MAKSTRPLSGQSQRKFFRDLLRADPGVAPDAAARLTEACAAEIAQIRVRLPLVVRRGPKSATPSAEVTAAAASRALGPAPAQSSPAFDPHAFSLIVLLRKDGRDALLARLGSIPGVDQLRAIAMAQHVALDPALEDRAAICEAIIAGTEQRVSHRQAAAS